jgi:hypothetical protein
MGIDVHSAHRMDISPDARSALTSHSEGMASNVTMRQRSAPITDLYDSACELLYAAQQVRATASQRGATPALAATTGCVDAALNALAEAISTMRRTAAAELSATSDGNTALVVEREFAALADALRLAQAVCDQTRARTAPAPAQLSLA